MPFATYAAAKLLGVLPRTQITRAVGRLCDARLHPAVAEAVVGLYVKAYRVDMDDCEVNGGFSSFDAFFTRPLREGARPIAADAGEIVSPSDGRLEDAGPVHRGGAFTIKGRAYSVAELVGDPAEVSRYENGHYAIVYLSPRDYHRVHAPVAGKITLIRSLPGDLYPVNSIGERHVESLFSINRRVAIVIDTETQGRVTVVMVGAMIVGRITVTGIDARDVPLGLHRIEPGLAVGRGDEIGVFHIGSTAVVFVEPGFGAKFERPSAPRVVRMGEPLARSQAGSASDPRSQAGSASDPRSEGGGPR